MRQEQKSTKEYPLWSVKEDAQRPERNLSTESLFCVGNGYMMARGYTEEPFHGDELESNRGTYIAGVFDTHPTGIYDMVNTPAFFGVNVAINGKPMRLTEESIEDYDRTLDMKRGVLSRSFTYTNAEGHKTRFSSVRFISMDDRHIACQRVELTPLNYHGTIDLIAGIDGRTYNIKWIGKTGIDDPEKIYHLKELANLPMEDCRGGALHVETIHTKIKIGYCYVLETKGVESSKVQCHHAGVKNEYSLVFDVEEGRTLALTKYKGVYTSRDGVDEMEASRKAALRAGEMGFDGLLSRHESAWEDKWRQCDIEIDGPSSDQQGVRFSIFQMIQSNSECDSRVNIGARGLSGERYRGNAFWDTEIYMLPFFIHTNPRAAANLLRYRYLMLDGARHKAKRYLCKGAMYPWMSSFDGTEQCPVEEWSDFEIHITADIAYAIGNYWNATGDEQFIIDCGAEMLIETARFWASRVTWSERRGKFVLTHVIGPDEFCGRSCNSTYINMLVVHNLQLALKAIDLLKERGEWQVLADKLSFDETKEITRWKDICDKIHVNFDHDRNLYLEDDTFDDLMPLDIAPYRAMGGKGQESVPHTVWLQSQVVKQADVILLMYLLSERFTREQKQAAWDYYEPKTLHSSSLSHCAHSIMASELGIDDIAVDYYRRSARLDIDDVHLNTAFGLHTAAAGGSWQVIVNGFAGMRLSEDRISFAPRLPEEWNSLKFNIFYRKYNLAIQIFREETRINVSGAEGLPKAYLELNGIEYELMDGQEIVTKSKTAVLI